MCRQALSRVLSDSPDHRSGITRRSRYDVYYLIASLANSDSPQPTRKVQRTIRLIWTPAKARKETAFSIKTQRSNANQVVSLDHKALVALKK
jgi:hypothetical protein